MGKINNLSKFTIGIAFVICAVALVLAPKNISASTTATMTVKAGASGLNVRKAPNSSAIGNIVGNLKNGTDIEVDTTTIKGVGCTGGKGWYKIISGKYNGYYTCSNYLVESENKTNTDTDTNPPATATPTTMIVTASSLNIRKTPDSSISNIAGSVSKGTEISVYATTVAGKGCTGGSGWYKIASGKYENKYICSNYLTASNTSSSSESSASTSTSSKYIDVRNMEYTAYKSDITAMFYGKRKSPQNFSIANPHTDNETFYFSTVKVSYVTSPSKKDTLDIYETWILKVNGEDLDDTSKGETMAIPYGGHGQTLQIGKNGNTFWTNSEAGTTKYGGTAYYQTGSEAAGNLRYWGTKNYGVSEYTFGNSTGKNKQRLKVSGSYRSGIKSSIDYSNKTMALVSGKKAYIVKFTGAAKNHTTFKKKISLLRTYNNTSLTSQGYALYNGYFYEYLNDSSSNLYISCYNISTAKRVYTKQLTWPGENKEAEGMQIIDGELFIGIMDTKNKTFTIATFGK